MKIAIVSPYSTGPARGNITTVRRITRHLCALGAEVLELPADTCSHLQMRQKLRSFRPDIIHGFHATYCGATACQLAAETGIPSVVTITGSDINDPQLSAHLHTLQAMQSASAIVCFDRTVAEKVAARFPQAKARTEIIPQAVEQFWGHAISVLPGMPLCYSCRQRSDRSSRLSSPLPLWRIWLGTMINCV